MKMGKKRRCGECLRMQDLGPNGLLVDHKDMDGKKRCVGFGKRPQEPHVRQWSLALPFQLVFSRFFRNNSLC